MSLGKHSVGRRPFGRLALLLALAMVVSAFAVGPLAGAGPTPKTTGSVYLGQDANVRYSEFVAFEANQVKDQLVKGTYYWS